MASFELLAESESAFRGMEQHHREFLGRLDPAITERPRVTGTIVAFEIRTDGTGGYFDRVGDELKKRTIQKGLLLRPLGNTVYLMPPYCLTDDERSEMYDGVAELVREVTGG